MNIRWLTFPLLFVLNAPVLAADSGRHQIYYGYGVMSRAWVAEKLTDILLDDFGIKSSGNSLGVNQLGYNFEVKNGWMLHLARTREAFDRGEAMTANLIGVRKEYRDAGRGAVYWGVSTGRATYSYSGTTPDDSYTALQLDLGLRLIRGPWFAYGNVGVGEAGSLGVGLGVSF